MGPELSDIQGIGKAGVAWSLRCIVGWRAVLLSMGIRSLAGRNLRAGC